MSSAHPLESVLVVGGCGFLGYHIVDSLLKESSPPRVSVLDLNTSRNRLPNVTYYDGDITSRSSVESALSQADPQVIFHTATSVQGSSLALHMRVNVDGTKTLLSCAQASRFVKAFIYTSSASVIHDATSDLINGDESLPLVYLPQQKEVYSHTKAIADALVLAGNRSKGAMLTVTIRPSSMLGENDGEMSMLGTVLASAAAGKAKYQIGNGKNLFDFTYVGNVADAHILAAKRLLEIHGSPIPNGEAERVDGQAFLITNDDPTPFWDITRQVSAAAGYPIRKEDIVVIPKSVGLIIAMVAEWVVWISSFGHRKSKMTRTGIRYSCMTRTFCIDKAKRLLGYKPRVDIREGIRRGVESLSSSTKKKL